MTDFKAKMHQIRFRRSPDPLAGFGGRFAAGEGLGWGRGGKGRGTGKVEGREREGPQVTVEPGPLSEPCYATAEPPHFNHCL